MTRRPGRPVRAVAHPRTEGGWWIMRRPDDRDGDAVGYVIGHVESMIGGAWKGVTWDDNVTHLARSYDAAVLALANHARDEETPPCPTCQIPE